MQILKSNQRGNKTYYATGDIKDGEDYEILMGADHTFQLGVGVYDDTKKQLLSLLEGEKVDFFYKHPIGENVDDYVLVRVQESSSFLEITAIVDGTAGDLLITGVGHGLVIGDEIEIFNCDVVGYHQTYTVKSVEDVDNFKVEGVYSSDATTALLRKFLIFKSTTPTYHTRKRVGAIGIVLKSTGITTPRKIIYSSNV
jgi:hypothetical protein